MDSKTLYTKWLTDILTKKNYKVSKYEFPEVEFTGGYLSKTINVKVTVLEKDAEETLDLIVKICVDTPDDAFTDAYLNEIDLYSKVVPCFDRFAEEREIEKFGNIAKCYGVSRADDHIVAVLENLLPGGYRVRDFQPFDLAHLKVLLEAYARWHAFSFALKDQKPDVFRELGKRKVKLEEWKIAEVTVQSFEQQIDYVVGVYEKKGMPKVQHKLKALRKNYRVLMNDFLENKDEEYLVVTHADAWNNNFLFKYNEDCMPIDVKIVDWQTAVIGSPLIDIAQLFFLCCFREELNHIDELLEIYYKHLSEKIRQLGSDPVKCFPHEAFLKSFKRYAPLGIAGVPFIVRMYYNEELPYDLAETSENGDFCALFADNITDFDMFFKNLDGILELCIERDLI